MSKVTNAQVREAIEKMLEQRKKRKFVESVDLQVMLRDYNPEKDKRFNSTTVLNHPVKSNLKICLIGTIKHLDKSKDLDIEKTNIDDLKKFNREAKLIKKWARRFDVILVSESISRDVTKLIGRYVTQIGKLPVPLAENEDVAEKIEELKKTIRFRVKKFPWLAQSVGIDSLDPEDIRQNITKSLNFLASLLPKGW